MDSDHLRRIINDLIIKEIDKLVERDRHDHDPQHHETRKKIEEMEEVFNCFNKQYKKGWTYDKR